MATTQTEIRRMKVIGVDLILIMKMNMDYEIGGWELGVESSNILTIYQKVFPMFPML